MASFGYKVYKVHKVHRPTYRLAIGLKAIRRERADWECPHREMFRDIDFENFPLNVCQYHKSIGQGHPMLLLVQGLYRAYYTKLPNEVYL